MTDEAQESRNGEIHMQTEAERKMDEANKSFRDYMAMMKRLNDMDNQESRSVNAYQQGCLAAQIRFEQGLRIINLCEENTRPWHDWESGFKDTMDLLQDNY